METTNNPVEGTGTTVEETANNIEKILDSANGTTEKVDADSDADSIDLEAEGDDEHIIDDGQSDEESESDASEVEATAESKDETEEAAAKAAREAEIVFEVDGKTISRKEAEQGYLRQSDYTKKTTDLKQQMVRYQTQEQSKEELRGVFNDQLQLMAAQVAHVFELETPPDERLLEEDAHAYLLKKNRYEKQQAAIRQMADTHAALQEKNAAWTAEQNRINQATALDRLSETYPEFSDKQKAPAILDGIGKFLWDLGFSAKEIEGLADHRMMDIAYRAFKAGQVQQQVAKVVPHFEKKPPLTPPGSSSKTTAAPRNEGAKRDLQRLKQTGSVNDAQAWILNVMKGK